MSVRSFFDTNVLVYADDGSNRAKQRRAVDLLHEHRKDGSGVVSLQVLQEYFVIVTRKLKLDAAVARRKVELWAKLDVVVPDGSFLKPLTSPIRTFVVLMAASLCGVSVYFVQPTRLWKEATYRPSIAEQPHGAETKVGSRTGP